MKVERVGTDIFEITELADGEAP
jgi:Ca2+-binding EF-hand superfamily protein